MLDIRIYSFESIYHEFENILSKISYTLITPNFSEFDNEKTIINYEINLFNDIMIKFLDRYSYFKQQVYFYVVKKNINHIKRIPIKYRLYEMYKSFYDFSPNHESIKYIPKEILKQIKNEIKNN
jgi:hypothetical protein